MKPGQTTESVQLTAADTALLQEYMQAMDEMAQREPQQLPDEIWDKVWPDIQRTGQVPAEYRDRIGVSDIKERKHHFEGDRLVMDDGEQTTKGYYDIAWERWNSESAQLNEKYHDVIIKALRYALSNEKAAAETAPLMDLLKSLIADVESMTPGQVQAIITDKLLSSAYLPMLNGALVNDFMQINTRGLATDKFTKRAVYVTKDGHKFTIEHFDKLLRGLSTPAKKILNTAIMFLTANNCYNTDRPTPTVEIPLVEYGEKCGYQLTPQTMATPEEQAAENKAVQNRINEFKKDVRRDLRDISSALWTAEETRGRNKGDYNEMRLISSHSISKGLIRINFDIDAAAYLVHAYVMQHPMALLAVDNRNPNAYVLGYKIAQHNSMDNNAARGTNNTLSVESLLAAAPEIQTIDDLKAKGQRNWKDKIKRPLENSLNELVKVNVLSKWEYRDPTTGTTYTPETAQPLTWAQYSRLMVDFIMVNAPDQSDRREAKEAAAAKAAADKEKPKKRTQKGGKTPQRKRG